MPPGDNFVDQFLDDYFSESEEHLATVRRVLLRIEEHSSAAPELASVQELLRALHTLKGLAGMVGLAAAEEVAHAMEDGARSLLTDVPPPPALLELLFTGEALIETCLTARRANATPPSPGPFVGRMQDVLQPSSVALAQPSSGSVSRDVGPSSDGRGASIRVFEFTPSAELSNRGVGVEVIRRRLASLGEITATVPRVLSGGNLVFQFSVATASGLVPDETWRGDGLSWTWQTVDPAQQMGVVVHAARQTTSTAPAPASASNIVRVDLARLDDLMRLVGELVVARARLGEFVGQIADRLSAAAWDELNETNESIERQVRSIREGVMRVRLVAVSEVFERMRFAIRDIARETQKGIHLEFTGQDTEIDKLVVDRMLEPLLHLVRNAASHGIEPRAERVAAGKEPDGTICLRARAAGDRMLIEVQDDGAGIDVDRVVRRARELDLIAPQDIPGPDALLDIICAPGFSTREAADMTSGRGVGMAVVRSTIRGLGGELFVDSVVGRGTRFMIELPLTLMITDALLLEIGDQSMAIPQSAVREIVVLEPESVTHLENNDVLSYRGRVLPLVNLASVFKLPSRDIARRHVLVVGTEAHPTGLIVDRVLGLREIVVHPVTDPMIAVPGIAGATELADGRVSLILDAGALVRGSRDGNGSRPRIRGTSSAGAQRPADTEHTVEHQWL